MIWGTPGSVSFEKRQIRMVVVDHHRVKVHRLIAPLVERILLDLAAQGLTSETSGWEPGSDGREFRIEVDGFDQDRSAAAMRSYGFAPIEPPGWFRWDSEEPPTGSDDPETVAQGGEHAIRDNRTIPVALKPLRGTQRLGSRDLGPGDEGMDVLTLQAMLGCPRTGVFDDLTKDAVQQFYVRKSFTSDGTMTLGGQCWLIPRTVERLRTGAAGMNVRLLCSALIGRGILPIEAVVETRYTVQIANVIRNYRDTLGFVRSEVVDAPTWASLIDNPWKA